MKNIHSIKVHNMELTWDIEKGQCFLAQIPVALMWIDSTLLSLMASVEKMVGAERFLLSLQYEGKKALSKIGRLFLAIQSLKTDLMK